MELSNLPNINDLLGFGSATQVEEPAPAGAAEKPIDPSAPPLALAEEPKEAKEVEEAEEPKEEEEQPEPTLVEELRQLIGFETEAGYEDTPEGVVQLVRDSSEALAKSQLDRLFSEFPLVQTLLEYQMNGGEPQRFLQSFFPQTDYAHVELSEDALDVQERLLRDELVRQGYGETEIMEEIEEAKSNGRLFKKAERALDALRKNQKQAQDKLVQEQKSKAEQLEQERIQTQKEIKDKIKKSTEFRGIPLPEKDKAAFEDYLFKAGPEGLSQYQKDIQAIEPDVELATALLLYRKFDLTSFIRTRAASEKAQGLRERLLEQKKQNAGELPNQHVKPKDLKATVENIDTSALFSTS